MDILKVTKIEDMNIHTLSEHNQTNDYWHIYSAESATLFDYFKRQ